MRRCEKISMGLLVLIISLVINTRPLVAQSIASTAWEATNALNADNAASEVTRGKLQTCRMFCDQIRMMISMLPNSNDRQVLYARVAAIELLYFPLRDNFNGPGWKMWHDMGNNALRDADNLAMQTSSGGPTMLNTAMQAVAKYQIARNCYLNAADAATVLNPDIDAVIALYTAVACDPIFYGH
jgi:hypothetical protein